jgi:hypothetical protein
LRRRGFFVGPFGRTREKLYTTAEGKEEPANPKPVTASVREKVAVAVRWLNLQAPSGNQRMRQVSNGCGETVSYRQTLLCSFSLIDSRLMFQRRRFASDVYLPHCCVGWSEK